MGQTLAKVLLHVVFSTKERRPFISPEIESALFAYIGGICRNHDALLLAAGGVADHVHLLLSFGRETSIANLVMHIKKDSSRWIKTQGPRFAEFAWQEGYGVFSIGESQREDLLTYIAGQHEHHARRSFQDEYLAFLAKYGLKHDPAHVWT